MECRQTSKFATQCACGGLFYEDANGFIYCVKSDSVVREPLSSYNRHMEPKHATSCHRDEDGIWECKEFCPVRRAQVEMFAE